jgi:rhodanese-related sulfurtransferase
MAKKKKTKTSPAGKPKPVSQTSQRQQTQSSERIRRREARLATKRQRMRTFYSIAGVVVLGLMALIIYRLQNPVSQSPVATPLPTEITVQEAYEKYQQGAFLLDVREPDEWEDYHVPNTTLIPLSELAGRVDELPRDQEVVVICRSGNRSQEGRAILVSAGFENVTSMSGGILEWREASLPVETGSP